MNVLLIDDKCTLFSNTVVFIERNGGAGKFSFLSLFSNEGRNVLIEKGLPENYDKSVVLVKNDKVYLKSSAALQIVKELNGFYPLLYGLIFVPKMIRDRLYDLIAKHRHNILQT
jgi:predicted DCC family thiol-disulfide oxidoreductase YuxK